MIPTRFWQPAIAALVLASGAPATPAAAQSSGDGEMERIVIAMPSGKRIVRYVPRTTVTAASTTKKNDSNAGVRPPDDGGDDTGNGDWSPPNVPDDLSRQIAAWLELYRAGDMEADVNGDGRLDPNDYTMLLDILTGRIDPPAGRDGGNDDDDDDDNGGGDDDGGDSGDNGDGDGDGDGSDNGQDGWTELSPKPNSRVIYVSSSDGSDDNDGLSPASPLRTLDQGMSKLRDGHPDWLLFKRGDTFTGSFGRFDFNGESADAPIVVGAYGEGPRPKIITGNSAAFSMAGPDTREHIAIMSLHLEPGSGHPSGGIRIVTGSVGDILIEDCYLREYAVNILVQGTDSDQIDDVRIRRNVILDANGTTHSQAIYASNVDGLLIEGNIIDRNGWDHRQGRSDATIFAHNCYIQRTVEDLEFRDNIVMRASSHGLQARRGGIIENNVFYQNPMAIMFGNEGANSNEVPVSGRIRHNVILEGVNLNNDLVRGNGVIIQHTDSVEVTDNILSRNINGPDGAYGISIDGPNTAPVRNALIANNVIHDWDMPFRVHDYNAVSVTFRDNVLCNSDDDKPLVRHRRSQTVGNVSYMGNEYLRGGDRDWFSLGSSDIDIDQWRVDHAQYAQAMNGSFVDGQRTMDTYARSIGLSGAEALIMEMRDMRKGDWDDRLTPDAIGAYFREGFALSGASQ